MVVYRLSPGDSELLQQRRSDLGQYPLWSPALALDGYQRITWRSLAEIEQGPQAEAVLRALNGGLGYQDGNSIDDARQLAKTLSRHPGALIAGEFRQGSNCTLYVLDLAEGILVKINLLT